MNRPGRNIHAENQHASFMRGFRDGVAGRALRPEFVARDEDEPLRVAYLSGYHDGGAACATASQHATKMYGFTPSILRSVDKDSP